MTKISRWFAENARKGAVFGHGIACGEPHLTGPETGNRTVGSGDRTGRPWPSCRLVVSFQCRHPGVGAAITKGPMSISEPARNAAFVHVRATALRASGSSDGSAVSSDTESPTRSIVGVHHAT
jgi:hypothetical protein